MSRPRSRRTDHAWGGAAVLVRSALFNAWFLAFTFAMSSAGIPLRWMAPWRTTALARHWARGVLGGLRVLCGIDYVLLGRENLPAQGPMLVAAEHQSAFDTVVWHVLVQSPVYVVKQELMRLPLFGPLLRRGGQIGIDRTAGAAALRGLVRQTQRATGEGRPVVIFPQGTRIEPGNRVPLQPGIAAQSARTGLPVIPVATDSGRFWGRRAFRKRPGTIRIVVCPPISPGLPRAVLLARIEQAWQSAETHTAETHMAEAGGQPCG
jgi:1-acyl-sn-glycerol-3-phosphate acyltransferase